MKLLRNLAPLALLFSVYPVLHGSINAYAEEIAAPSASTVQSREAFAKNMIQNVLTTLHDSHKTFPEKQALLKQTFTNIVDINWIARFVLGKTWNTATAEQKTQYTALYHIYLTNTYVSNFDEESVGSLKNITITGINNNDDDAFVVHTSMGLAGKDDVKVDYLVRDEDKKLKVIDIRIEGVGLLATHRSEFGEIATSGGIAGVIDKLQQMASTKQTRVASSTH